MRRGAGRLVLAALLIAACPVGAQTVLSLHGLDPAGTGRPRLGGGDPVSLGPSRLDVSAADVLTVGLDERASGATVSLWLGDAAASAYAALTEAAMGEDIAVVVGDEVAAVQRVTRAVTNGQIDISGLASEQAEAVAERLRGRPSPADPLAAEEESSQPLKAGPVHQTESLPVGDLPPAERLPISARDLPGVESAPGRPASVPPSVEADGGAEEADAVALAFIEAVRAKNWRAVADQLHPEALARLRPDALATLRQDRQGVSVEGTRLDVDRLLGGPLRGEVRELSDADLAVLYLAGLDVADVWGESGAPRRVVGRVPEADRVHVVLAASGAPGTGVSEVSVVTVRRDASGQWRPVLTHARGF